MDKRESLNKEVLHLISTRSVLKRDVFELAKLRFAELKSTLELLTKVWEKEIKAIDPRLEVSFKDQGHYYCQLTIAGDVLLFALHTNVFKFDGQSMYWKSAYLQEDTDRAYCATIQVYNFLADSFRYQRQQDLGYLVARIFVNYENHFFVEGKKQLGYLFNDFVNSSLTEPCMKEVLLSIVLYTLQFDLYAPTYQSLSEITVQDVTEQKDMLAYKTGKRLGFQFSKTDEDPS